MKFKTNYKLYSIYQKYPHKYILSDNKQIHLSYIDINDVVDYLIPLILYKYYNIILTSEKDYIFRFVGDKNSHVYTVLAVINSSSYWEDTQIIPNEFGKSKLKLVIISYNNLVWSLRHPKNFIDFHKFEFAAYEESTKNYINLNIFTEFCYKYLRIN